MSILLKQSIAVLFTLPALAPPEADTTAGNVARLGSSRRAAIQWKIVETANFRLHYQSGSESLAREIIDSSERVRNEIFLTWFGDGHDATWKPKCHIFLHVSPRTYSQATNQQASFGGYSVTQYRAGHVVSRRIDLLQEGSDLTKAVLPHEITHVVFADRFANLRLPLWVDEGIAVLSEPPNKRLAHTKNLLRFINQGTVYSVEDLMNMTEYPAGSMRAQFYAQSVSLVEFLVNRKGTQGLVEFLKSSQHRDIEAELNRVYGFANFRELEQEWSRARSSQIAVK